MSTPKRPKTTIQPHSEKEYLIFNDDNIELSAVFSWIPTTRDIGKILFRLVNKNFPRNTYKSCYTLQCINEHPLYKDYIVIQLSREGGTEEQTFDYSGAFTLNKDQEQLILFKVGDLDCDMIAINCKLEGGTPETKDGAVIVGG